MPKLTLADFVDIVSKSGTPKATKVAEVKNRPKYEPATDFYRPLRERLVEIHRKGAAKSKVDAILGDVTDRKKLANYPDVIAGYTKWWGRKSITWFEPSSALYSAHGVDVVINPELGLEFGGTRYLIKLYFKAPTLSKHRVDLVTHLMEVALRPRSKQGEAMAILDTRKAKLFSSTVAIPALSPIVDAELAYIAVLWQAL